MELWPQEVKIAAIAFLAPGCFRVRRRLLSDVTRRIVVFASLITLLYVVYLVYSHIGYNSDLAGSPDGRYVARILVSPRTLIDSGRSSVILRRSWSPVWRNVWTGDGWLAGRGEASPHLHWIDNSHLVIDYIGVVRHRCVGPWLTMSL